MHRPDPAESGLLVHADGSAETVRAGKVCHWPAGHTATTDEPVVFIQHVTAIFITVPTT